MREFYERLAEMARRGTSGVLATVVRAEGSTPRAAGAKMLVAGDGRTWGTVGGGSVEAAVIREAAAVLEAGAPRVTVHELDERLGGESICGGRMEIFLEPLPAAERVYIFGAGHVGRALAPACRAVGFAVTVIDPRPNLAVAERFPSAEEIIVEDYVAAAKRMKLGPEAYVIVMTPNHEYDEEVVRAVLDKTYRYIGMIGSRKKVATVISHLTEAGFSESRVRNLHSPIGLDIGAETPEEIAVSILAEMVACRRKGPSSTGEAEA